MQKTWTQFFGIPFALSFFLSFQSPANAQWAYTYGDGTSQYVSSMSLTSDNGYILAGTRWIGNDMISASDGWIVKLDQNGKILWQKSYGGAGNDSVASVRQTSDGGYIAAGTTNSFGDGDQDAWVLKLDQNGDIEWQKTYGGTNSDSALFVEQLPGGGYIGAGNTYSFGSGSGDAWVFKLTGDGTVEWQKTYGGTNSDYLESFQRTRDGGYVAAGGTYSFGTVNRDMWVLKLSGNGGVEWFHTFGGPYFDYATSVRQTNDDGFIVAGFFGTASAAWIGKLTSGGAVEWQKSYGGEGHYRAISVEQTQEGGYIVLGEFESWTSGTPNAAWLLKLDGQGNASWMRTYGGAAGDQLSSALQTADGGYIAAGNAQSFGSGWSNFWALKLDDNGSSGQCPFEGPLDTTVTPGTAGVSIQSVSPSDSTATAKESTAEVKTTDASIGTVCPFAEETLLKVGLRRKNGGEGTVRSLDGFIQCPDRCKASYPEGFPVLLTASPDGNSTVVDWKPRTLSCVPDAPCGVFMNTKKSVKAVFDGPRKLKVKIVSKKHGAGRVWDGGHGMIDCPGACEIELPVNSEITLYADKNDTSTFLKWNGKPCKGNPSNECTFTMDRNYTVKAVFKGTP